MNINKIATSFLINIFGLGSLWIVDMLMTATENPVLISEWATTKSILFIGSTFILFGIDQAIIRTSVNLNKILIPITIQFILITLIIIAILQLLGFQLNLFYMFISLILIAFTLLLASYYRNLLKFNYSQIMMHSWKIFFLVGILMLGYENYFIVLLFSLLITVSIFIYFTDLISWSESIKYDLFLYKKNITIGVHYFFATTSLITLLYLDQIILNYLDKTQESSLLFSYITIFIAPGSVLLGFSGFILLPYIKRSYKELVHHYKKKNILFFFLVGVLFTSFIFLSEYFLFIILKSEKVDYFMIFLLFILFLLRFLYLIPTTVIGAFASNKIIAKVSVLYYVANVLFVLSFVSLYLMGYPIVYSMLTALIIGWMYRCYVGYRIVDLVIKDKN